LTAQKSGSGLYYVIKEAGDGVKPTSSSIVTAYKGYILMGRF
jgi:FKBP-type peptidyl-prolyl cis-trans isomerase FkpA